MIEMNDAQQAAHSLSLPYPGLRAFHETESDIFFGRDEQIDGLLERLQRDRFVAIAGESGCGKSSLVRAGLIPALKAGFLRGGGVNWRVAELRPGNQPIRNLAAALVGVLPSVRTQDIALVAARLRYGPRSITDILSDSPLPPDTELLIVVDQFEELIRFRARTEPSEADAFVALLLDSVTNRQLLVRVVLTLRTDYLGNCAMFSGLPEALNGSQYLVPRLGRAQLEEAIVNPARVHDGDIAPDLANQLINEVSQCQEQLPVLGHAMLSMWKRRIALCGSHNAPGRRDAPLLTLDDYRTAGGLGEALSRDIDSVYAKLGDAEKQRIARRLFCALWDESATGRDTRRPCTLLEAAEIVGVTPTHLTAVVERFRQADHAFLTPPAGEPLSDDTVLDVVHESLFRHWKLLGDWITKEADDAKQYRVWLAEADAYQQHEGGPLTDNALERMDSWWAELRPSAAWASRYSRRAGDFATVERLLSDSRRACVLRRALRRVGVAIAVMVAAALLYLGARSLEQREQEKQRTELLRQQTYSAAAFGARLEPIRALQLALEAQGDDANAQAGTALHAALRVSHFRSMVFPSLGNFDDAKFLDGDRIVTIGEGDGLAIWDTRSGQRLDAFHDTLPRKLAVHVGPTGALAAIGSDDGTIALWDLAARQRRWVGRRQVSAITDIAFSPDGQWLATASDDGTAVLWEVAHGQSQKPLIDHLGAVIGVAFSYDGQRLATVGNDARIVFWDIRNGKKLGRFAKAPRAARVTFDAIGRYVAATAGDSVTLWDAITGRPEGSLQHTNAVTGVAFSLDGRRIATTGLDGTLRVWDANTRVQRFWTPAAVPLHDDGRPAGELGAVHDGEASWLQTVAFCADGRKLVTTGRDGSAKIWDVEAGGELASFRAHEQAIHRIAYDPTGGHIASASDDGVVVSDLTGQLVWRLASPAAVRAMAFDATGTRLAASSGADVTLWKLGKPDIEELSFTAKAQVEDLQVFRNRERVAVAAGREITVWSAPGQHPDLAIDAGTALHSVAISPDDRLVAAECAKEPDHADRTRYQICLWDARTGAAIATLGAASSDSPLSVRTQLESSHRGSILALRFSSDGTLLASSSEDKTVKLWNVETHQHVATLGGHRATITGLAISPDGGMLVSSGDDLIRLWNASSYVTQEGFPDAEFGSDSVAFAPNGASFAAGGRDGVVRIYAVDSNALRPLARERTPIHLTEHECNRYVGQGCSEPRTVLQLANEGRHLLHDGPSFYGDQYLITAGLHDDTYYHERDRFAAARTIRVAVDAIAVPIREAAGNFINTSIVVEDGSERLAKDLAAARASGIARGAAVLRRAQRLDTGITLAPDLATRIGSLLLTEQATEFAVRGGRLPWATQAFLLTPPATDERDWATLAATTVANTRAIRLAQQHLDDNDSIAAMNTLSNLLDTLTTEPRPAQRLVLLRFVTAACQAAQIPDTVRNIVERLYPDVDDAEVLVDFAAFFLNLGMTGRARMVIDRALSFEPTDDQALLLLANAQEDAGQFKTALATLGTISPLTPIYRDAASMAGRIAYDKLKRLHEGYRWMGIAVGLQDSDSWANYAEAAWSNGRFSEAQRVARRILEGRALSRPMPTIELAMRFVLVAALSQAKEYAMAEHELDALLEQRPWPTPTNPTKSWSYTGSSSAVSRIKDGHLKPFLQALLTYCEHLENLGTRGDPDQLRKLLHDARDAAR